MRIAYLTTCSPVPPTSGHALRVHANWRVLQRLGEVEVFAFDCRPPPRERERLRALGIHTFAPRHERRPALLLRHARSFVAGRSMLYAKAVSDRRLTRLRRHLDDRPTDLLVIGDTWLADLLPALDGVARRVVVDTHNVETRLYDRICAETPWPRKLKYRLYRNNAHRLERYLAEADQVWAVSSADAQIYAREQGIGRVAVLPNTVDVEAYAPQAVEIDPQLLVFTGSYGYRPNEAAALHLIGLSRRLSDVGAPHRIQLVGRDPTTAMRDAARDVPGVSITGAVDDVRRYIARAGIVVAPLTSGSGTKYKILEAMALARPVVTTPVGAEGLDIVDGIHALIAPDLDEFERRVVAYLRAPGEVASIGARARRWLVETHSLPALEGAMRASLRELGLESVRPGTKEMTA